MGFFADLKADLSQAVSELKPDDERKKEEVIQAEAQLEAEPEIPADASVNAEPLE